MKDITDCIECGTEMEAQGMEEEEPVRAVDMECPDCGATETFGQVFYPDERFTIIAPGDGGCSRCTLDAEYRTQQVGHSIMEFCADHCPGHMRETYEWAKQQ